MSWVSGTNPELPRATTAPPPPNTPVLSPQPMYITQVSYTTYAPSYQLCSQLTRGRKVARPTLPTPCPVLTLPGCGGNMEAAPPLYLLPRRGGPSLVWRIRLGPRKSSEHPTSNLDFRFFPAHPFPGAEPTIL